MSEMKVVPPIEITAAKIIAYNVPETDYDEWVAGTYPIGTRKIIAAQHTIYEVLATTTTDSPLEGLAKATPTWMIVSPTNRWKMFNKRRGNTWMIGTTTTNPESIDITLRPAARINSFGLVGVRGSTVRVVMTVPGTGTVYDKTFNMSSKAGGSWYQYYFGQFVTKDNVAQFDLPAFNNADIRFLVSAPGGTAQVGMLIIGMAKTIGVAVYGTSLGDESYSGISEDAFGNVTITPRGSRQYVDYSVVMTSDQVTSARRTLGPLSDTAALYIGSEALDYTIIVGRFERLAIGLPTYDRAEYSLEVRSLM
jgi:hypothetical protein